jgi:hypothetical protein
MFSNRSEIEVDNFEAGVILAPLMTEIESNKNGNEMKSSSRKRKEREEVGSFERENEELEKRRRSWAEILTCVPFHLSGESYREGEVPYMITF